jgi:phage repressor protein C with HTH and peptisase S24 domain
VNTKNKTLYDALDKIGAKLVMPDEKLAEYVLIPKVAAKAGAGGSLETGDGTESLYSFRKDWLNKLNIHAAQAVLLEVVGDSMEPLMREGDTIMVDKGDTEIVDGKIYVLTLGDELKVKIVQKGVSGYFLCSENPRYKPIPVTGPDLDQFKVHGRVRWVGKEL